MILRHWKQEQHMDKQAHVAFGILAMIPILTLYGKVGGEHWALGKWTYILEPGQFYRLATSLAPGSMLSSCLWFRFS